VHVSFPNEEQVQLLSLYYFGLSIVYKIPYILDMIKITLDINISGSPSSSSENALIIRS
jgi:hypothetical protein